jgi:aspartate racemase
VKVIGLIGGMSWESSLEYYRILNTAAQEALGGFHSCPCIMVSLDFAEIEALQRENRWDEAAKILTSAAGSLEAAGAGVVVLCTNTMHKVADAIQAGIRIPLLHIADATAGKVAAAGLRRVGLLGTRFTMEEDFYRGRLTDRHGLDVLVPERQARETVHRVIYEELCLGVIRDDSRSAFRAIIARLAQRGAQGVILGCTEIELLVHAADSPLPLFPTTRIHALAAVEFALSDSSMAASLHARQPG